MTRQRTLEDPKYSSYLDLSVWPKVNTTSFSSKKRKTFYMRKQAVELYIDGRTTGKDIYKITGIQPKEVRYFVKRCLEENILTGTIYGYSALIPNKRIKDYSRSSLPTDSDNNKGMSGAFKLLLETYPSIKNTIDNAYLKQNKNQIHEPVIKIKNIFKLFIRECRSIGIKLNQYPFITKDMGKRSVERYCEKLHLQNLIAASKRDGEKYSRYMASTGKGSKNTIITRPYQRVQFDAHVVDLIMSITANTVEGYEVTKTINRINLLTIIDEATRVILGYHLSYNQNYSSTDVLQCIKNAISPRMSEPTFTIHGLKYSSIGGFPSTKFPECRWAVWDELLFDNAKANLSQIVKEKLQEFVGSFTNAGPVSMPERRGLIERFFGLLEEMFIAK
ncbi:hypothetical protein [Guptibacillus spartinae]|uniref:hypothetical protein n=1 Tax=Guptibacillus spartinae TaxID=3025679 RepID=UPI00235F593E|nr:hypothetical protein [Pseudalkalibacillus spartinae]